MNRFNDYVRVSLLLFMVVEIQSDVYVLLRGDSNDQINYSKRRTKSKNINNVYSRTIQSHINNRRKFLLNLPRIHTFWAPSLIRHIGFFKMPHCF